MKYIQKYWPLLAIIAAFFCGQFSGGKPEKELIQKFEQERERDRAAISNLLKEITHLNAESQTIREQMVQDSIRFTGALERNQRAYTALKRKYYEIDLRRANSSTLDSIVSRLYPE